MFKTYIGADVDSKMTELAVERNGKVVCRRRVETSIVAMKEFLAGVGGSKALCLEEGPMADWLYRNLKDDVDELVICDPRRNKLIACDGDKDDPIDAGKLAELHRGGYLRAVHHSDSVERVLLKQWVGLYHDRVKDAVRQINKIRARCRMHGMRPPRGFLSNAKIQKQWLAELGVHGLRGQLELLLPGLDVVRLQVRRCRHEMSRRTNGCDIITRWQALGGVGLIRAVTLLAYLDTPWRFANPKKLWKYCGVGLVRTASGTDKKGRPRKGKLQLAWAVNRRLKGTVIGAAVSAIEQGSNVFAEYHRRLEQQGVSPSNARHAVARKMLTVMWGMWKNNSRFEEALVCGE
jgi:transposase